MPFTAFEILTVDELIAELDAAAFTPAMRVHQTVDQTLTTATATTMTFDTTDFDNGVKAPSSTTSGVATVAGLWHVEAVIHYASNATGLRHAITRVAGVDQESRVTVPAVSGAVTHVPLSQSFVLSAGQFVQIRGEQSSGGNLLAHLDQFAMHLISESP